MNYLCQYIDSKVFFVISKSTKKLEINSTISFGKEFFKVIQEIEIR